MYLRYVIPTMVIPFIHKCGYLESLVLLLRQKMQHLLIYLWVIYPPEVDDYPFPWGRGRRDTTLLGLDKCAQCLRREFDICTENEILQARTNNPDIGFLNDKCSEEPIGVERLTLWSRHRSQEG